MDFLDVGHTPDLNREAIPDTLHQQIILQAFNSRTVLSGGLLQYGMIIGHQNARLGIDSIDIQQNLIKASLRPLPGEPQIDVLGADLTIGACEQFLLDSALLVIRGLPTH